MQKPKFKVGDRVRLKRSIRVRRGIPKGTRLGSAKIQLFYKDIEGGVKLDDEIDGFVSWNVEDLTKVGK